MKDHDLGSRGAWVKWVAGAIGVLLLLLFPIGTINAVLVTFAGLFLDRRRAKAATASRRDDSGRP
jgi:hypothetical protein